MKTCRVIACLLFACVALPAFGQPGVDLAGVNLGRQAYFFAYPLVLMDMTRRAALTRSAPNTLVHAPAFPDEHAHVVVRPNADTLYSSAWLDLAAEPMLLHVPDTHGRYYLMQLMDAWTETISVPGKRTTGTNEQWFAIVGPGWKGTLPKNVTRIDCPTNMAWLLGRTQTNGVADYATVHAIQAGYRLMPLSAYPEGAAPAAVTPGPTPAAAPPALVARMNASEFFTRFEELLKQNPPHAADREMMRRVEAAQRDPHALEAGATAAAEWLRGNLQELAAGKDGWSGLGAEHIGKYGTDYGARAATARVGLGALPREDAVYRQCYRDSTGQPFDGSKSYVLHFEKGQLPPVRAFWSLTVYDEQGYFTANPIHRYAIGDRDALKLNADGSLDIRVQHDAPEDTSNWLPAPAGRFNLSLRMYWPEDAVLRGLWSPPAAVQR